MAPGRAHSCAPPAPARHHHPGCRHQARRQHHGDPDAHRPLQLSGTVLAVSEWFDTERMSGAKLWTDGHTIVNIAAEAKANEQTAIFGRVVWYGGIYSRTFGPAFVAQIQPRHTSCAGAQTLSAAFCISCTAALSR
jgi:hypothetical protein